MSIGNCQIHLISYYHVVRFFRSFLPFFFPKDKAFDFLFVRYCSIILSASGNRIVASFIFFGLLVPGKFIKDFCVFWIDIFKCVSGGDF